jgi:hypothetical protein
LLLPAVAASTAPPPHTFAARSFFSFFSERPVRLAALPRVFLEGFCRSCMIP